MNELNIHGLKYMIARLIENANEARADCVRNPDDPFMQGRRLAYYEMLDMLKSDLEADDANLRELGLDIDVDAYM